MYNISSRVTNPLLSQILHFVQSGWPKHVESSLHPYFHRRLELSVLDGSLLWGNRVVVPPQGQKFVLYELHDAHLGITKMKALSRSYVWWPGITKAIESLVQSCLDCQKIRQSPAPLPSMGVACTTLEPCPLGFCRSFSWSYVLGPG